MDIPSARIMVFGYNLNIVHKTSRATIRDHAKNLLYDLADARTGNVCLLIDYICMNLPISAAG